MQDYYLCVGHPFQAPPYFQPEKKGHVRHNVSTIPNVSTHMNIEQISFPNLSLAGN